jgi:N-acetylglucosaminyldiphosphoundecaprenol N-acetyl-beta-D-mannosaminyltransferase
MNKPHADKPHADLGKIVSILGIPVNLLSRRQVVALASAWMQDSGGGVCRRIVTLNAEIAQMAVESEELADSIRQADLIVADGIGVQLASKIVGQPVPERVPGVELVEMLAREAAAMGKGIYLLGAAPGVAEKAAEVLKSRIPALIILGTRDGYFKAHEEEELLADINRTRPALLLVAMGAPKQELWLSANRMRLQVSVALGVGGSFDVISGNKPRAPRLLQTIGLEWAFRMAIEPRRLKRIIFLPKFIISVFLQRKVKEGSN